MDSEVIKANVAARKAAELIAELATQELATLPEPHRGTALRLLLEMLTETPVCASCGKPVGQVFDVYEAVWERAGVPAGHAHLECLEKLLNRRLRANDFQQKPANDAVLFGFSRARGGPMTDDEARLFGRFPVPYGEFRGRPVDDVPMDRLDWYADQTFGDQLRRYLASRRIKNEKRDEDEGGWDE